ncbi:ATP-binding protein [Planomonospora parontospora]|uniref:ATP-binding protein n=1 Tax=Planomonospora parontospora TaxID=58119 RepID=UPI0016718418|nr:ATP-binding protein [Planomonospora parontospora]GGL32712.1 ATPase AAA [Planomonospora parontospora subsp. antibiotica]GII17032.1 ATPase AAA [Planomonospora parontospora subsp. antibiotica]
MKFLNRTDELEMLGRRISGIQAELLVVYGRRRVGKTELLAHLAGGVRSFYFEATDTVAPQQLRDFTDELARVWGNELLAVQPLGSWEAALTALAQFVGTQRTLVVLDEFQLLAGRSRELETTLSRWWRTTGRDLPIVLVLAGSELSFFEDKVLAGQLYGRRTGQLKLAPFLAREAALFHPGYSAEDRVRAYSICGGVPYYLERFTDDRPLAEHLLTEVFERTGLLHDEAELMLRQSIADLANHTAVLRSIAHGHNRNNEISQRTGLTPAHVVKIVSSLEQLGLVERLRPITASSRAKKTAYAISDQFLRFHHRFVEPARSQLRTSALAAAYLSETVLPQLDHHASYAWEDMCRQYVLRTVPGVMAVGRWWGQVPAGDGPRTQEREIDVVGVDGNRTPLAVGMCKWTAGEVDFDELNLLDRLTPHVEGSTGTEERFIFSRNGFSARLAAYAATAPGLRLVTPQDVYA